MVLINVYTENFVRKFSKKLRIKYIHLVKETTLTVGKKPILMVLSYLGSISSQNRTKLTKLLKKSLIVVNCKYCLKISPD